MIPIQRNTVAKQQRRVNAIQQLQNKISRVQISKRSNNGLAGYQRPRYNQRNPINIYGYRPNIIPKRRNNNNNNNNRNNNSRQMRRPQIPRDAYTMCRLDPFKSNGRLPGIPDGSGVRRMVIDHRMTTTFTFGSSGTINLFLAPFLPSPVLAQCVDTTFAINGITHGQNSPNPQLYIPVCLPEWSQQALTWDATAGQFNNVAPVFDAAQFRFVTLGWRLYYTGTSLTNSGNILVSSAPFSAEAPMPNPTSMTIYSSNDPTNTNIGANQVFRTEINCILMYNWGSYFSSSQTVNRPLSCGARGLLRHSGPDYEFRKIHTTMNYITNASDTSDQTSSSIQQSTPTPALAGRSAVVQGIDDSWDMTVIAVTGGTTGQSFVLDLIACVEYAPQAYSPTYAMAKTGPPENKALMQRAENIIKTIPLATALDTLVNVGTTAAGVVAAFM